MGKYIVIAIVSGILSSASQVLLKKSTKVIRNSWIADYLNIYVISGYAITFICMGLTILAFKGLPYKYGAILESLVYVYIMILSKVFLNEKMTSNKIAGNLLIVTGVLIFSLGG